MKNTVPRVGIAVFVVRDGRFLMGQRRGAHGAGTWGVPGGHLEFGETFADAGRREVIEETGVTVANLRFAGVTNDHFEDIGKHYVTVWMLADWMSGEPKIMEPDKLVKVCWRRLDDLPDGLFLPMRQLLASEFFDGLRQAVHR